ncbi:fanconi-associated nuclease [Raphidocelis subcapitata]|uniref:Fanconi-associated nuclease n=1 Tax=Raphidocelis subcapitata TaxID=307507 RepID=A0A2V0NM20_9CHLO|nr:fanconi-associated nuclease [Raphidocelis subcapitata]|eukprot:GBF88189.1 fanconi-associated nuclease [Raphidocelis subcapitata]
MALRGQGSLQSLLGRQDRRSAAGKRSSEGAGRGGSGGASSGQHGGASSSGGRPPPMQQGSITSFFAPDPKRRCAGSEDAGTSAAPGASAAGKLEQGARSASSAGGAGNHSPSDSASAPPPAPPAPAAALQPSCAVDTAAAPALPSADAAAAALGGSALVDPAASSAAAVEGRSWSLEARIVGRRHARARAAARELTPASRLALRRDPDNCADANAIQVLWLPSLGGGPAEAAGTAVGHLPASVACHLAPLLDAGRVAVESVSLAAGTVDTLRITLVLQRRSALASGSQQRADGSDSGGEGEVDDGSDVEAAVECATAAGAEAFGSARPLVEGFEAVRRRVRERDAHLLDAAEWGLLEALAALPPEPLGLALRLLLRRRVWHAVRALSFPDLADAPAAVAALVAARVARTEADVSRRADLAALLDALPADTLRSVLASVLPAKHPAMGRGGGKAALVAAMQAAAPAQRIVTAVRAAVGPLMCMAPEVARLFERLQRLYFLSEGQDISAFVAAARGGVRWPRYPLCSAALSVWPTRSALLAYEEALARGAALEDALQDGDNERAWSCLEPALAALRAGAHKQVAWDDACAPMPNPVPVPRVAAHWQASGDQQQPARGDLGPSGERQSSDQISGDQQQQQQQQQCGEQCGEQWWEEQEQEQAWQQDSQQELVFPFSPEQEPDQQRPDQQQPDQQKPDQQRPDQQRPDQQEPDQLRPDQQRPDQPPEQPQQEGGDGLGRAPAAGAGAAAPPQPAARPLFYARFTAGWVYASLGTVAASLLERGRRYAEAVELLRLLLGGNACVARRGAWWARLSINLEHLKQADAALEAAEAALADPYVRHGDRLALQRRVLRLGKPPRRWKLPAWAAAALAEPAERRVVGRPLAGSIGSRNRYYGYDGSQQVNVEELALQHYAREAEGGWRGIHTEGGIWATLFGLVMWDILFSDVPGVFQTPFQSAPLDLDTDAFFPARRAAIEARLQEVALDGAADLISGCWEANRGALCRGVSWSRLSLRELLEIAECVGGVGLSVVLRLMAEDHGGSSGGLPDLLLWRLSPHKEARMVEVKGPTDRLSEQQRAWIACMAAAGMQVEVCKVVEPA